MRTTATPYIALLLLFTSLTLFGQSTATYEVVFESNWSQATHPHSSGSLPSGAHWSPFAIAVHNDQVDFVSMGQLASQGVENIAETGNTSVFLQEVTAAINAGNAIEGFQAGDIDTALGSVVFDFDLTEEHPMCTILSMIAPSPDWFVAVDGLSLFNGTDWTQEVILNVYAYDAGTDNGADYTSSNSDTNPAEVISSLQSVTPFSSEIIGTFTVTLSSVLGTDDVSLDAMIQIYPNPSNGIFQLKNQSNELMELEIFNVIGQSVYRQAAVGSTETISLENVGKGIYFLRLETQSGGVFTQKLIKR